MKIIHTIPALLMVILLCGCLSKSPETNQGTISTRVADLTISLTYVSRDTLIERHGKNNYYKQNPFVDYPGRIPPKNIVVFETSFRTDESTVLVELKDVKLKIEDKSGKAVNVEYLRNLWQGYTERDQRGRPRLERAARDFMLPEDILVEPGNPASGYLVFPYGYPKEGGDGMLTIIASTSNGDKGTIEIPMSFSENGAGDYVETEDNTGIFAESDS